MDGATREPMVTKILFAIALLVPLGAVAAEPPRRIVSINLCADELLVTLADPEQIAALSIYAADPLMSFTADEAGAFRHDVADAEQIVDLQADLILAGRFTKRATREMLERIGYRVELLDAVTSVDDSIAQIERIAALVGHPERGAALIARIEAARERAVSFATDVGERPTAAVYQRRGYVTGAETLTGELLTIAGFRNAGGGLAGQRGGFVPLERIVSDPPDFIVVAALDRAVEDQGAALLAHPALARLYPPDRRIVLPERLTVCGGPSLPAALDRLTAEARRVARLP
jgi:iron complex transport system substrate-binding protein